MKARLSALKKNPRAYASTATLTDIRSLLRHLDYTYHDQNAPLVPDEVYDVLRAVHDERAKKPYAKVGAVSSHAARRVKLPVIMGSLNNHRSGSASFNRIVDNGPFVVSDKEDGISLALIYENGVLVKAYQRGDGTTGTDSSGVIPALNVPHKISTKSLIVRCEFTMNRSTFNKYFSSATGGKYDNPRNGSGGLLNRNKPDPAIKRIKCVVHEIMAGPMAGGPISRQFSYLKGLGFHVVPHKTYKTLDADKLSQLLRLRKSKALRDIDGIVVTQDKNYKIKGKYPEHAFAYKENSLDDSVLVKVVDVEWNASRYGKLSPRIIIEPTRIGGVTVRHFTGHNAFYIANGFTYQKRNKAPYAPRPIGKGAMVRAIRSGDVIPYVMEVVKAAKKASTPKGNVELKGIDYYVVGDSDTADYKQIVNFFSALGVDGLKLRTVTLLAEAGFDSVYELLHAEAHDLEDVIGHTTAVKITRSIKAGIKQHATLLNLAVGSSMFGNAMGSRRLAPVFEAFPNAHKKVPTKSEIVQRLLGKAGYSQTSADLIASTMPAFIKYVRSLDIKVVAAKALKIESSAMKNHSILFTSVRDAELQSWIVRNGGKMASSVKSATTLVVKEGASNNKTEEAARLKIPVLTIDEFKKKFKVKL